MNAAIYEAIESLRLVNCGQCACLYAVPAALLVVSAGRELHCPHGHVWTWGEGDSNGSVAGLRTALADARARLEAARRRIEALTPLAEPSLAELRRRSNLLAERAEDNGRGRALCPYCAREKFRNLLAEHIRRRHKTLLIEDGGENRGGGERGESA